MDNILICRVKGMERINKNSQVDWPRLVGFVVIFPKTGNTRKKKGL